MRKPLNCGGTLITVTPPPSRPMFPAHGGGQVAPASSTADKAAKTAAAPRRRSPHAARPRAIEISGFGSRFRRLSSVPARAAVATLKLGPAPCVVSTLRLDSPWRRQGSRGHSASTVLPLAARDESKHEGGTHGPANPQVEHRPAGGPCRPAIHENRGRERPDFSRGQQVQRERDRRRPGLVRFDLNRQGVFAVRGQGEGHGRTDRVAVGGHSEQTDTRRGYIEGDVLGTRHIDLPDRARTVVDVHGVEGLEHNASDHFQRVSGAPDLNGYSKGLLEGRDEERRARGWNHVQDGDVREPVHANNLGRHGAGCQVEVVHRFGVRMGDDARILQGELAPQNVEGYGQAQWHVALIDESEMLRTDLRRQVGWSERIDAELEIGGSDSIADARSLNLDGLSDERRVSGRSAEGPSPGTRFSVDPDPEDDVGSIVRTQVDAEKG